MRSGRWTITSRGGTTPRWSRDGRELFVLTGDAIAVARIDPGPVFRASPVTAVVTVPASSGRLGSDYELGPDGRFLLLRTLPAPPEPPRGLIVLQALRALHDPSRD